MSVISPLSVPEIQQSPLYHAQAVPDQTDFGLFAGTGAGCGWMSGAQVHVCPSPVDQSLTFAVTVDAGVVSIGGVAVNVQAMPNTSPLACLPPNTTDRRDVVLVGTNGIPYFKAGTPCPLDPQATHWSVASSMLPPLKPLPDAATVVLAEVYVPGNRPPPDIPVTPGMIIDKRTPWASLQLGAQVNGVIADGGGQVFNVKNPVFAGGAKGDWQVGAGTATMSNLTPVDPHQVTLSGSFFFPTDVGKAIGIEGAGPAGGTLYSTIASYVSGTTVMLADICSQPASGQSWWYGHDDSAAFAAAWAAANVKGGEVFVPIGFYAFVNSTSALNNARAVRTRGVGALDGGKPGSCLMFLGQTGVGSRFLDTRDARGLEWQNLTVEHYYGNFGGYLIDNSLALGSPHNCVYRNVNFQGPSGNVSLNQGVYTEGSYGTLFDRCSWTNYLFGLVMTASGASGAGAGGLTTMVAPQFDGATTPNGFPILNPSTDLVVYNPKVECRADRTPAFIGDDMVNHGIGGTVAVYGGWLGDDSTLIANTAWIYGAGNNWVLHGIEAGLANFGCALLKAVGPLNGVSIHACDINGSHCAAFNPNSRRDLSNIDVNGNPNRSLNLNTIGTQITQDIIAGVSAEIAVAGTSGAGIWRADIDPKPEPTFHSGGFASIAFDPLVRFGGAYRYTTAKNSFVEFETVIGAGVWNLALWYLKETAGGIVTATFDDSPANTPTLLSVDTSGPSTVRDSLATSNRTTTDGVLTLNSPVVTSATANFTSDDVGSVIYGSGILTGTKIVSVQSATQATMSTNATASLSSLTLNIGAFIVQFSGTHRVRLTLAGFGSQAGGADGNIEWLTLQRVA